MAAGGTAGMDSDKACVLVVDDDSAFARAMQRVLQGDCSVVLAQDGRTALEAIKQRSFEAILSDIEMPGTCPSFATCTCPKFARSSSGR